MQKSTCFAVLISLDDILACHFPFVSLAKLCQQLHMCFYLVVVCSSIIGWVSFDSLSGLAALCSAISSVQYCWYLCIWVNLYVNTCDGLFGSGFDGIADFSVVLVRACSELQAL